MQELFHPEKEQFSLPTIFQALSDPIRLDIIKHLATNENVTCSSCNDTLPKSALSHHFKVLRESGLINVRIEGKRRILSIRYEDLEERFPGVIDSILKNLYEEVSHDKF